MQNKITALLIVLLVGTTLSLSSKFRLSPYESLMPENSIMKRLNNVFIQLKNIDDSTSNVKTFDQFKKVIYGLFEDLDKDTKKHNAILAEMQKQCAEEDEFRAKESADAKKAQDNADAERKVCGDKLETAKKLKSEAENQLADEQEKKKQRTEIRNQERKIFESEKKQYDEAISFLRDFIKLVKDKFNGKSAQTSFIQFSEGLLRHTSGLKRLDAAVPVLVMMAQYTSAQAGDYKDFNATETVKTLNEKLDFLLKTLEADLANIINIENKRIEDFNSFIIAVDQNIAKLKATIAELVEQIRKMSECVTRETAIFNEASKKFVRNTDLAKKAISMCKKFVEEVEAANASRKTEMDVINEILTLLEIRFGKVPQEMRDYMESIKIEFAKYVNKTELIKYEIYKHAALVEDALGKDIVADKKNYVDNAKF